MHDFHRFFQTLPTFANPVHLSFRFINSQITMNLLKEMIKILPLLTNLRYFFIELGNIKLTESDMLLLAKGLLDCKQIEHLTFKYLDNVMVSIIDILKFIMVMAKYSSFPKLDLFFRKLFHQEWQDLETRKKLDDLENINYSLTKQSIHLWKM